MMAVKPTYKTNEYSWVQPVVSSWTTCSRTGFFGKIALETIQLTILIKLEEIENREGMIS